MIYLHWPGYFPTEESYRVALHLLCPNVQGVEVIAWIMKLQERIAALEALVIEKKPRSVKEMAIEQGWYPGIKGSQTPSNEG